MRKLNKIMDSTLDSIENIISQICCMCTFCVLINEHGHPTNVWHIFQAQFSGRIIQSVCVDKIHWITLHSIYFWSIWWNWFRCEYVSWGGGKIMLWIVCILEFHQFHNISIEIHFDNVKHNVSLKCPFSKFTLNRPKDC